MMKELWIAKDKVQGIPREEAIYLALDLTTEHKYFPQLLKGKSNAKVRRLRACKDYISGISHGNAVLARRAGGSP